MLAVPLSCKRLSVSRLPDPAYNVYNLCAKGFACAKFCAKTWESIAENLRAKEEKATTATDLSETTKEDTKECQEVTKTTLRKYVCPACGKATKSTIVTGKVQTQGHCGREFRVKNGAVCRQYARIIARPATRRWHQQNHTDEFNRSTEMTQDDIVKHISGPVPAQSKFLDLNYSSPPSSSFFFFFCCSCSCSCSCSCCCCCGGAENDATSIARTGSPEARMSLRNPTRNPLLSCYPARNLIQANPILTAAAAAAGRC